jgi:hypothetical protein
MLFSFKTILNALILANFCTSFVYSQAALNGFNFNNPKNLITLLKILNDLDTKLQNNQLNEINFFEKWIVTLLVKFIHEKNKMHSNQNHFWTFRQG